MHKLTVGQEPAVAGGPESKLLQYKQHLITAVKQQQYVTALQIAEEALVHAPTDLMLLDFRSTIQAKVQQDASTSQEGSSDDEASDMEGTTSADEESMDDCTDSADDTTSSAAGPDEAADDDPCGSHCAGCLGTATGLAHSSHAEQESVQEVLWDEPEPECAGILQPEVSSIVLQANCCTLTHQQRVEMKQRLTATADQEQTAAIEQKLLRDDPLLAGL